MALVKCVVSGGQTGADQAGLLAAMELDINTGGYAPKGWLTEKGPAPWLGVNCDLEEWTTESYIDRTRRNVEITNATVIFGKRSPGSNATEEHCRVMGKPCCWILWSKRIEEIDTKEAEKSQVIFASISLPNNIYGIPFLHPAAFRLWLKRHKVSILNVAGNRESKNPGIGEFTKKFLLKALK